MRTEAQGKTPPLPPKTKFTWFALNLIRKHKEEERIKEDTVIEKKNKEGEIFTMLFPRPDLPDTTINQANGKHPSRIRTSSP